MASQAHIDIADSSLLIVLAVLASMRADPVRLLSDLVTEHADVRTSRCGHLLPQRTARAQNGRAIDVPRCSMPRRWPVETCAVVLIISIACDIGIAHLEWFHVLGETESGKSVGERRRKQRRRRGTSSRVRGCSVV